LIIKSLSLRNFQSYRELNLDLTNTGLLMIFGETGSGKSTIMDAVAWALYGETGKGVNSDDVKSWLAEGDTQAIIEVDDHIIVRTRGTKNDLTIDDTRGINLTDTQRIINTKLGVDFDSFLNSSYLSQFSKSDTFFIASAKERRSILEGVVDLSLPIKASEQARLSIKQLKQDIQSCELDIAKATGKISAIQANIKSITKARDTFDSNQRKKLSEALKIRRQKEASIAKWKEENDQKIEYIKQKLTPAETYKELEDKIKDLDSQIANLSTAACKECGELTSENRDDKERLLNEKDTVKSQIKRIKAEDDIVNKKLTQAICSVCPINLEDNDTVEAEVNPFDEQLEEATAQLASVKSDLLSSKADLKAKSLEIERLYFIDDKSFELRGLLLGNTIQLAEANTTRILEKYFDSKIRVALEITDADKVDVTIYNNVNLSTFKQLSGGERCMLKLAFTISLMQLTQNKLGKPFNLIMLDEPLNGLDENLKVKALQMLEELLERTPSVLVIEHSPEVQTHAVNSIQVSKSGGVSYVK